MAREFLESLVDLSIKYNDYEIRVDNKLYLVELDLNLEENYSKEEREEFFREKEVYKVVRLDTLEREDKIYIREITYYIREK